MSARYDVAVVGAGAAGTFCAGVAAQRGARVVLLDHAAEPGEKIRISGGGRCNFTNLDGARLERYAGEDPGFARHALRAYPPQRFVELVRRHGIGFHEKHRGQLFCDESATRIVRMLRGEADAGGVHWRVPCSVHAVRHADGFALDTDAGTIEADSLVVATGGLSIPKIGATDFGHRLARQFGLAVVPPRPALVPFTFSHEHWQPFGALAGMSVEVDVRAAESPRAPLFREDLLFTHRGLSGPAALQASTYWRPGTPIEIDLVPGARLDETWTEGRHEGRQQLVTLLAESVPRRLAQAWIALASARTPALRAEARVAELGHRALRELAASLHHWRIVPDGTEGYRKAEATAGGVSTRELDPRTMESRRVPGLYFIGEVVDITGWLGGYNFQWAWASGHAAAIALTPEAGR